MSCHEKAFSNYYFWPFFSLYWIGTVKIDKKGGVERATGLDSNPAYCSPAIFFPTCTSAVLWYTLMLSEDFFDGVCLISRAY